MRTLILTALLLACNSSDKATLDTATVLDSTTTTPPAVEYEGDEPGECSDDADNDQDGLFDCDDEGCAGSDVCATTTTTTGTTGTTSTTGTSTTETTGTPSTPTTSTWTTGTTSPTDFEEWTLYGDYNISNSLDIMLLAGVTTITGNLDIEPGEGLVNLHGLESLTEVGGILTISGSDDSSFISLEGLNNLNRVGGDVIITHDSLSDLSGLDSLELIGSNLIIAYCDILDNISGLYALRSIGENLDIYGNRNLCQSDATLFSLMVDVGATTTMYDNDDGC